MRLTSEQGELRFDVALRGGRAIDVIDLADHYERGEREAGFDMAIGIEEALRTILEVGIAERCLDYGLPPRAKRHVRPKEVATA